MALQLYDTLAGEKRPFKPADPSKAKIYVCGPTVYDFSHLGHARCYVVYDVLIRHLRASGQPVAYVRNVTDIDDKILKRAKENGEPPKALAERFTAEYHADMASLGNVSPDIEPRVSDHLGDIINLVQTLIAKGHAYESEGDVYFSVESFPTYGKLSHRDLSQLEAGASGRMSDAQTARKRHPADFAVWKSSPEGQESWDSPWGKGRPGWHIECSAMSMAHLGETLDLHGGGLDLVFPHHENEIAQSEAATGCTYSHCWMHNGFVEINQEKMGKSLGNFFTARELFKRVEPEAIRLFTMTVHYRAPLSFDPLTSTDADGNEKVSFPSLEEAERRLEYLYKTRSRLRGLPEKRVVDRPDEVPAALGGFPDALQAALDDDLNMPVALAKMAELLSAVNELCDAAMRKKGKAARSHVEAAERGFAALEAHLGLGFQEGPELLTRIRDRRAADAGIEAAWVEGQITARADARAAKDFERADAIRAELTERGVELLDSPDGTTWQMA